MSFFLAGRNGGLHESKLALTIWMVLLGVALPGAAVHGQSTAEPHVRWITGGMVLGPTQMMFSDDGATLITHSASDYGLKQWNVAQRTLESITVVKDPLTHQADISDDKQLAAFSTHGGALSLRRIPDGELLWAADINGILHWLRFSPDNRVLLETTGFLCDSRLIDQNCARKIQPALRDSPP